MPTQKDLTDTGSRLRTILSAVGNDPSVATASVDRVSTFLVGSTQKVIEHYRQLLKAPTLSPDERARIEQRLAREEQSLREYTATVPTAQTYSAAA